MDNQKSIDLLEFAAITIQQQQAQINQLMPLARAYESIDMILRMGQQQQGSSDDAASILQNHAEELRREADEEKAEAPLPSE